MRKYIDVPDVVHDENVGKYKNPLIIQLFENGGLAILDDKDRIYLYSEQVRALYGGLRAHFEEKYGTETST